MIVNHQITGCAIRVFGCTFLRSKPNLLALQWLPVAQEDLPTMGAKDSVTSPSGVEAHTDKQHERRLTHRPCSWTCKRLRFHLPLQMFPLKPKYRCIPNKFRRSRPGWTQAPWTIQISVFSFFRVNTCRAVRVYQNHHVVSFPNLASQFFCI